MSITPVPINSEEEEYEIEDGESTGGKRSSRASRNERLPTLDIGRTVILTNPENSAIAEGQAVLINSVDCYVGKYLGEYISTKEIGATMRNNSAGGNSEKMEPASEEGGDARVSNGNMPAMPWKILGTFENPKSSIPPFLWGAVKKDDFGAFLREASKCNVIIYDLTSDSSSERFQEVRALCDYLRSRAESFATPRVLIVISSLHSWSQSKKGEGEQPFTEENYQWRMTKPKYKELQLLERYVVTSGKTTGGKLKSYVVGAGAIYGAGESCLHHWFFSAWHNDKYLQIYGNGNNLMPTVYIQDLAKIVQNVMDVPPNIQRYLIAVDPIICQQDQIAKAISQALGSGRIKRVPAEDIYLNKELSTYQADQHLFDLRIQSAFALDNFNMEFVAEQGFVSIVGRIVTEYRQVRNLDPLKVCFLGPASVGKSTISRQISDLYGLHHFTKEDIVSTTIPLLMEASGDIPLPTGVEEDIDEQVTKEAKSVLAELDKINTGKEKDAEEQSTATVGETIVAESEVEAKTIAPATRTVSTYSAVDLRSLSDELSMRIARWRLLTPSCLNQGYILDGLPENFNQSKTLFTYIDDGGDNENDEEVVPIIEGKEVPDARVVPDLVVILEASDEFLTQRLQSIPAVLLPEKHKGQNIAKALANYREMNSSFETTTLYYLDMQEIPYYPVDITTVEGLHYHNLVVKLIYMLGKPRNYSLKPDEEEAIKDAHHSAKSKAAETEKEDMAMIESREMEERKANIQQWMEKLVKVRREEFDREETALTPIRQYLMAHVVPTLTKGLIHITRLRPDDPIEYLAEFIFSNNSGGVSTTPKGDSSQSPNST